MKISLRALTFLMILALPFLVAFRLLADAAGIPEPWATLLFAFVAPLIVQVIGRIYPAAKVVVYQGAALLLTLLFVFLSGGFAGLVIPVFADDVGTYIGSWIKLLLAAWGSVELSYRLVLKALMEKGFGFRKLAGPG